MARIYNQKTGLYEDDTLDGAIDKKAVNDYLMQKYNLNSLGDDLKNAQQAQREDTAVANQAQGFSQIAAAIGGVKNSDEFYNQLRNQAKQSVVDVQDATKAKMQALDNEQQINKAQREADMFDPNSKASVSFRKTIEANFPNVAKAYGDSWQNVSAGDQESIFRPLQLKENISSRQQEQAMRRKDIDAQKALANTPESRMQKLNGTDKARFDNAVMAIKALDEMEQALSQGQNTFSIVGDNDYTAASRRATEAYGRMQSGGAINKDEEARFEKTLPRMTDPNDMQRKKIKIQRDEMISRLKTLGFSPEQVGISRKEESKTPKLSEEDEQAIAWAKEHKDDKRALNILKMHGVNLISLK